MHRIDTPTAQVDKFGAGKNGFTAGNPQTGELPTALDQDFFDSIQEELTAVIESASIALSKASRNQLLAALKKLFLQPGNNLSEILNKTAALNNLGGAPLESPTFTGTPKGPTAVAGTNSTQLATTAFVQVLAGLMLKTGNNLSEIAAAGPDAVSAALSNLSIAFRNFTTFSTATTWTCPPGVTQVSIDACAAGGGGGYAPAGGAAGGGGGGASVLNSRFTVVPGTVYTITVGAPGVGGTSTSVNGTQGGSTTFGSLLTLNGGGAGLYNGSGGAAGGGGALPGMASSYVNATSFGGHGGGCALGGGGSGGNGAMNGQIPGMFGGGGGGGGRGDGGRGAYGIIRMWW